ncbi:MAG: hypothetical protein F6K41_17145 [Symploca sp. SIO3E6]|nr:hypothetical protein [Caldora sp. SIO3E6]
MTSIRTINSNNVWEETSKTSFLLPSDLKETRGRGDAETRREGLSCMVVKKFFHRDCLLPSASCLLPSASCLESFI